MPEVTDVHRQRAEVLNGRCYCSDVQPHPCKTCKIADALAVEAAEAQDAERARWLDAVPAHIDDWADAVAEEAGYDLSAPLVILLRRLAALRADSD